MGFGDLLTNQRPGIIDLGLGQVILHIETDLHDTVTRKCLDLFQFRQRHQRSFKRLRDQRFHAFCVRSRKRHHDNTKPLDKCGVFLPAERQQRADPAKHDDENCKDGQSGKPVKQRQHLGACP